MNMQALSSSHETNEHLRKVGLLNAYSTRNLGDAAIMTALTRMVPGASMHAKVDDIAPCNVPGLNLTDELGRCDAHISVGGDIFNNARPSFVTRNFIRNVMEVYNRRQNTIVFGQTIPSSCRGLALAVLAETFRRVRSVTVRDAESHRLLTRYGVAARLSYDAAFVLRPDGVGVIAAQAMFDRVGFKPENTALLSVRGFDGMYRQCPEASTMKFVGLAKQLVARGHQVGILIQSDASGVDTDWIAAKQILEQVPEVRTFNMFDSATGLPPVQTLMGVLSLANIVVGLRYHATVLRLAAGRQPYNLPYSRKGRDLGARIGLSGVPLEDFEPSDDVRSIEATASKEFDPTPISQDVQDAFRHAFGEIE